MDAPAALSKIGKIRPMRPEDAEDLARLEGLVEESPWSKENFLSSMKSGHKGLVSVVGGSIAAWAVAGLVLDEAELLIIGTAPEYQRRGLARRLLSALESELRCAGAESFYLEVRESNAPAIGLYERFGFEPVGRRKGYYPKGEGREDAVLMKKCLKPASESTERAAS